MMSVPGQAKAADISVNGGCFGDIGQGNHENVKKPKNIKLRKEGKNYVKFQQIYEDKQSSEGEWPVCAYHVAYRGGRAASALGIPAYYFKGE